MINLVEVAFKLGTMLDQALDRAGYEASALRLCKNGRVKVYDRVTGFGVVNVKFDDLSETFIVIDEERTS